MLDEAAAVQNNMNFFSGFIAGTGIDVRVAVISSPPSPLPPFVPPHGVCVDPPLGAGGCPDPAASTNLPKFIHWINEVGSHNALSQLMATFSGWQQILRPSASATFVVVTDDEADPSPTTQEFTDWVNAQPEFNQALWRFSGIFCIPGQTVTGNCAGVGNIYNTLVTQTGGVAAHMGSPDWTVVFQQLADAVVADAVPVDCEWVIPPPPPGESLDANKVNVRFTGSSGTPETIFAVGDLASCDAAAGGWYYDNPANPSKVLACPTSCTVMQADDNALVEVLFGCATQILIR
jgi:hypothetical protein